MLSSFFGRTLALGLGLIAVHSTTVHAAQCDLSWAGTGISAAPTDSGHLVALRGTDGLIRLNEWRNGSKSWSGWMVLPSQTGASSDPWVQYTAEGGQNVYARSSNGIILQWICVRNASGGLTINTTGNVSNASNATNRVTSARTSTAGQQQLFATFTDGTLKSRTWSGPNGSWDANWTDMGITNVQGSPWATQVTSTTVNLYVRLTDGSIRQNYWNGSTWSGWMFVVNGANADPSSVYTNYHYLYSSSSTNTPEWAVYNGHNWTSWTSYTNFPVTSSLVPVSAGGSSVTLYGIAADGAVWSLIGGAASRVNCLLAP